MVRCTWKMCFVEGQQSGSFNTCPTRPVYMRLRIIIRFWRIINVFYQFCITIYGLKHGKLGCVYAVTITAMVKLLLEPMSMLTLSH